MSFILLSTKQSFTQMTKDFHGGLYQIASQGKSFYKGWRKWARTVIFLWKSYNYLGVFTQPVHSFEVSHYTSSRCRQDLVHCLKLTYLWMSSLQQHLTHSPKLAPLWFSHLRHEIDLIWNQVDIIVAKKRTFKKLGLNPSRTIVQFLAQNFSINHYNCKTEGYSAIPAFPTVLWLKT